MWMLKRVKVALYERALVYRDRDLERVLAPGKYWLVGRGLAVQVYDVSKPEADLPRADLLVAEKRGLLEPFVQIVELGDREAGLVYKNERLTGVLAPGTRQFYWRGPVTVRVEVRDLSKEYALDADTARVLTRALGTVGLAAGQEILTRDKVSLRLNLTALWQVTDAVKARAVVSNAVEYVYKELQLALREAVSSRTLDELLTDKGALDREVAASAGKLEGSGLAVRSVGVKDVILPGEMNTARLMDENPTLLRLKELETLEKVTEKVGSLTVYGGLEGVLKNLVPGLTKA